MASSDWYRSLAFFIFKVIGTDHFGNSRLFYLSILDFRSRSTKVPKGCPISKVTLFIQLKFSQSVNRIPMPADGNCLYYALFHFVEKHDLKYIEQEFHYEQGAKNAQHLKSILILYVYLVRYFIISYISLLKICTQEQESRGSSSQR